WSRTESQEGKISLFQAAVFLEFYMPVHKVDCYKGVTGTIYEYGALTLNGEEYIQFKQYVGKHVLFVNVTDTAFTAQDRATHAVHPLLTELNALQEELKPFGVVVLGFPCNQFGKTEPAKNSRSLWGSSKYVRPGGGFVPNFQLFEKGDVNGEKEQKVFTFLKNACPPTSDLLGSSMGPDGVPVMRWYHRASVAQLNQTCWKYLKQFKSE
uniref:Glutathione peroxidase n=1 Tax=Bos taurus TaxID=9913 RepID=A0AAA9TM82_BOVIN